MLSSLNIKTLNQIALLCGLTVPAGVNKAARVQHIISRLGILDKIRPRSNTICAIDVGLANLSYCIIENASVDSEERSQISSWTVANLHDQFGSSYAPLNSHTMETASMLDSRRYLNFLASSLTREISISSLDWVVIETQRTRSNANSVTLPTIMQNYTFENMLIANIHAQNPGVVIWPMASAQMTAFWINRFVTKQSLKAASKNSKSIRHQVLAHWLITNKLFDASRVLQSTYSPQAKYGKTWLPMALGLTAKKLDDLIDSLLYSLTLQWQLRNAHTVRRVMKEGNTHGIHDFVETANQRQIDLIRPVIQQTGLELTGEFEKYS